MPKEIVPPFPVEKAFNRCFANFWDFVPDASVGLFLISILIFVFGDGEIVFGSLYTEFSGDFLPPG